MNTHTFSRRPFDTGFEFADLLELDEFEEEIPRISPEFSSTRRAPQYYEYPFHEFEVLGEYGAALGVLTPSELKAVKITSTFETGRTGGFGGLTGNMDGQGLSFGLMNFTIKAGSLVPLLQEFINKHATRFAGCFGKDAARFKDMVFATKPDPKKPKRRIRDVEAQMTFVNSMNAVPRRAKGNKIVEPWVTYFACLEKDSEFQKIQVKAVKGAIDRAKYWCKEFGFKTERGFVFMFDLVSSHGGWWLNAGKFKGKRKALLDKMLADKKAKLGSSSLTELETMEVIANMIAEASSAEWRNQVRIRKLWFVSGKGKVHGHLWDIKKDFGVTDNPPDFTSAASTPELEWSGAWEYEASKRKHVGTDCGRSGKPAAKTTQEGGRCTGENPPICPDVTGILSEKAITGIPFEYVEKTGKDPATKLTVVTKRLRPRIQRFMPSVRTALTEFVANMNRFGMPIEAILTAGSHCCRCISRTNTLSNHSYGDAFDLVGVRWANSGGKETIVHNWNNAAERALLRRINACLRLSFVNVIDYYNKDHRDHFHGDMNHGKAASLSQPTTMRFTQEALTVVLGRNIPITGKLDKATRAALTEFAGGNADALRTSAQLKQVLTNLFTRIASTAPGTGQGNGASKEWEVSRPQSRRPAAKPQATDPPGVTLYEDKIVLGQESPAKPKTGIFIPQGFRPQPEVDLIVYLHGMKAPSGLPLSATIDQYWSQRYPFQLREAVNQSARNVVLVAPTLGAASQAGKLTQPGGLDWYLDQVTAALARRGPFQQANITPQVGNIILACHSAGGRVMRPLAVRSNRYSSKIRECWGFDCLYSPCDAEVWRTWAVCRPNSKLFVYYLSSTSGNSRDLQGTVGQRIQPTTNVKVEKSSAPNHNRVPVAHMASLLAQASFLK